MKVFTNTQITQLDNMNASSQRAGGLGTLFLGQLSLPDAGTLAVISPIRYRTSPALQTATYVHAAIALTSAVQTVTTSITNPDVPRIVTIKGNASGISGDVVITGTNINDEALTETIALSGASEVLGTKAFKTVTTIRLPIETHAGTDTVSIGAGVKIGFPAIISNTALCIAKNFDGSVDAGTVTAAATVEESIYAVAGTLDGAKYVDLYFLV